MTGESGQWGQPTEEEMAAIIAAIDVACLRPVVAAGGPSPEAETPWRFSGRWWTRPVTARRARPWVDRGF